MEISVEKFEKMYSKTEVLKDGQNLPLVSLEDDMSTEEKDYYFDIVLPISSNLEIITLNNSNSEITKKLNKYLYFTYDGIKNIDTELNTHSSCRSFSIIYKSTDNIQKSIKYDWYRLRIKYILKSGAKTKAVIVYNKNLVDSNPETTRGTVTTTRNPPTEK